MLANLETPRPLPPAKARRANAVYQFMKTPPPAYGSPFTFPARRQGRQDILGSPMSSTFQMVGWNRGDEVADSDLGESPSLESIKEKSSEELKDMVVRAHGIIKERENELGLTAAVCKGLYQNNVALKSKHQALLARLPISPPRSESSPANLFHSASSREASISLTGSSSESALSLLRSPQPSISIRHTRKVSIATADITLLADQNAELLEKLEKLEQEATSADQAGRRELKRLEKEITYLRDALEKTQARSEELEEKVQGAMANEAWRRKKEREAKFNAMRNLGREAANNEVLNFAPEGSRFGGPTEGFSFFPTAESPDPNRRLPQETDLDLPCSLEPPEHHLITQLLTKVKELEEANGRILQQQSDTATQLSAMQRDTAHISRVYECLSDPSFGDIELLEDGSDDKAETESPAAPSGQTIRFMSLKRNIENEMSFDGTCIVHPEFEFTSAAKNRKSVMGLFDECPEEDAAPSSSSEESSSAFDKKLRAQLSLSSWGEGHGRSTWSSISSSGVSPHSAALSPLHFFSPASHAQAELSPLGPRSTLQHELDREFGHGASWEAAAAAPGPDDRHLHLRTSSLYDLSQFSVSVPPSPSPPPRTMSRRGSDELDFEAIRRHNLDVDSENEAHRAPSLFMPTNSLQLSVEPPTPEKRRGARKGEDGNGGEGITATSSPRVKMISEVLRARTHRWGADRRLRHRERSRSRETQEGLASLYELNFNAGGGAGAGAADGEESVPRRLMSAVDNMIDGFAESGARARAFRDFDAAPYDEDSASEYDDDASLDFDFSSTPLTPKARPRRARHSATSSSSNANANDAHGQLQVQLHPASPPRAHAGGEHGGLLFRVWLWIQFAIVVFVFLYAMARRGPAAVLTEGESKRSAVARRR